jgi:hypothetical protein
MANYFLRKIINSKPILVKTAKIIIACALFGGAGNAPFPNAVQFTAFANQCRRAARINLSDGAAVCTFVVK